MNNETTFELKPSDFAGTAWINLKNSFKTTDPYLRNERLLVAHADLESAGETLGADLVSEVLGGHAYHSFLSVVVAYLEKKYGFSDPD